MIEKNEFGLYETKIDDMTYTFEKWGAEESLGTILKIAKMVGKPIGLFVGSLMNEKDDKSLVDKDIKTDMLAMVFDSLAERLDEDLCISLFKKLSSGKVHCNGAKINFDLHYQDRLDHLMKVIAAALEVQYGNFFAALLALVPKAPPKKKGPSNRAITT